MPQYNIRQNLKAGENTIEFTPTETGRINFSCSMGMYTGSFNVVDENGQGGSDSPAIKAAAASGSETCGLNGCADAQVIKAVYTSGQDIQPADFKVKVNQPVSFEIDAKDDGSGCMSTIKIQSLYENPQPLKAGQTIVMNFTPANKGKYLITCAMNVPRGTITVE